MKPLILKHMSGQSHPLERKSRKLKVQRGVRAEIFYIDTTEDVFHAGAHFLRVSRVDMS